jgi:hypothetical protein
MLRLFEAKAPVFKFLYLQFLNKLPLPVYKKIAVVLLLNDTRFPPNNLYSPHFRIAGLEQLHPGYRTFCSARQ